MQSHTAVTKDKNFFFEMYAFIAWAFFLSLLLYFFVFPVNQEWLAHPVDGIYSLITVKNQISFFNGDFFNHGWSPIQGLGFFWHGFASWFFPEFWPSYISDFQWLSPRLIFSFTAFILFIAVYFLARSVNFPIITSLIGGLFAVLFMFPIRGDPLIYLIVNLSPHLTSRMALCLVCLGMFARVNRSLHLMTLGPSIALAICLLIFMAPLGFLLFAPACVILGIFILVSSRDFSQFVFRLSPIAISLGIFGLGPFFYVWGISGYTPVNFNEFQSLNSEKFQLSDGSLLFQGGRSFWNPVLYCMGLVGAILAARNASNSIQKQFSIGVVVVAILSAGVSYLLTYVEWNKPPPKLQFIYFEFIMFPIYALFAGYLLINFMSKIALRTRLNFFERLDKKLVVTCIVIGSIASGVIYKSTSVILPNAGRVPWPAEKLPMIEFLTEEISISPNKIYNGRVANFTGDRYKKRPHIWMNQHEYDVHVVVKNTGHDFRTVGLWDHNIPTLEHYSASFSPILQKLVKKLMMYEDQKVFRSMLTVSKPHIPLLNAIGVKFIISEQPYLNGTLREPVTQYVNENITLFLHKLHDANTQGWSPTQILESSFDKFVALLDSDAIDLRTTFISDSAIPHNLVDTQFSNIRIISNGMEVKARTLGWSVLILPFEFSNCFRLENNFSSGDSKLFRANFFQLAVLFKEQIDAKIVYEYGPFLNTKCVSQDAADVRTLL